MMLRSPLGRSLAALLATLVAVGSASAASIVYRTENTGSGTINRPYLDDGAGHLAPINGCVAADGVTLVSCGGGSATVTGSAANNADGVATSTGNIGAVDFPYLWNGSTFDRWRGDATNGAFVNVKASALPSGAATSANQTSVQAAAGSSSASAVGVQGVAGGVAIPVTGTFWQATQPVSAASLPLPSGASTAANQSTGNTSLASIDTKLPSPASGRVPVDGSGVTQPVSIATNTPAEAVSAGTGGVASASRIPSAAATTNGTSAKASAGRVYKIVGYNNSGALRYLKFYNKASAPTVGTDTIVMFRPLPPGGFAFDWSDIGFYFSTGIAYAMTAGSADADTTALGAGDVLALSVEYN